MELQVTEAAQRLICVHMTKHEQLNRNTWNDSGG